MPADGRRTGGEPVFKRIPERIGLATESLVSELERQELPLGLIHGDNANTNVADPLESQQFLVSMP